MGVGRNIYPPGATVTFHVRLTTETARVRLEYQIVDFLGQVVARRLPFPIPHSPLTIRYRPRRNGVYYLRYRFVGPEGLVQEGTETFSVIPPPQRPPVPLEKSAFGLCFAVPELMPLAGLHWHRRDFTWDSVEPKPGEFHWEDTDQAVADGEKYGFQLMPILDYSASWASTGPPGDPRLWAYPPRLDAWGRYVSAVVSRYQGRIHCWEVWNEPDGLPHFFIGGSPKAYADLLRVAYQAAKQADPTCTIIGVVTGSQSLGFIEEVFRHDGLKYLDVVSVHPYRPRFGSPEDTDFLGEMARLRRLIDKYGGKDKPVWLTEFGWPADDLDPDAPRRIQHGQAISERDQVAYLVRFYAQALSTGYIQRLFWFVFRHPSPNFADSPDHGESLVYYDFKAKPVLIAHRTMSDLLMGAKPIDHREFGTSGLSYRFQRGTNAVTVIWCTQGKQLVAVTGGGRPFAVVDVMYNRRRYPATSGTILLPCDEVPFFLEGDRARVGGHLLDLQARTGLVSLDASADFDLALHNPTERPLRVRVSAQSSALQMQPAGLELELSPGQTARRWMVASVREQEVVGHQTVTFRVAVAGAKEFEITRRLLAVAPGTQVIDDFEAGVAAWHTNAGDAHVAFSEVRGRTDQAHNGTHSLWWHCRSHLWNNLFRDLSGFDLTGAQQLEFWVFLPRPAEGNQTLTVELYDRAGSIYDHFGPPFTINEVGKWLHCIMNLSDFRRRVSDTVHDLPPDPAQLARFQFNYTAGKLEAYFDGVQFRR